MLLCLCLLACALALPAAAATAAVGVAASPDPLTFGSQDIDDGPTLAQATTFTNFTGAAITIGSRQTVGSDFVYSFDMTDCSSGQVLQDGESCALHFQFDPATVGAKSGSAVLHYTDVDGRERTATAGLEGSGAQTALTASPGDLQFGSREIAAGAGTAQQETLENTGTEPVTLTDIAVTGDSGDFPAATVSGACTETTTLAAGETCKLAYSFDPSSTGLKSALVTVSSNADDVNFSLDGEGIETELTASPTSLSFGPKDIDDGATAVQESTITNTGTETVGFTDLSLTGADNGDFNRLESSGTDCTSSTVLTFGESCKVRVEFDPATTGGKSASVSITSNAPATTVSLAGTGTQTRIESDTGQGAFGSQDIDDGAKGPLTFTITNSGTEPVTLTGAGVTGTDASDFARVTPSGGDCTDTTTLNADDSCTLRYTFDPATTGSKEAALTVDSNAPDETIDLTGTGTQTELTASPSSLSFGSREIGAGPSSVEEATVANTGTEPVTISDISVTGEFGQATVAAGDCDGGTALNAGDTCKLRLRFDPSSTGAKSGTATVDSNAPDASVALDGTGTLTQITPSPTSLSFGPKDVDDGATTSQPTTITNTGTESVTLTGIAKTGHGGDFPAAPVTGGCTDTTTLAPGGNCKLAYAFDPEETGARTATVTIASNAPDATVALDGTGTQTQLTADPVAWSYGKQDVDDGATAAQGTTITNTGTEPVTFTGIAVTGDSGDFPSAPVTGGCTNTTTLPAGGNCKLAYAFNPTDTGDRNATVTISSNAPDIDVSFDGQGTQTQLNPEPTSLSFGPQEINGGPTDAQEVLFENVGTEDVTITGFETTSQFERVAQPGDCSSGQTLAPNDSCAVHVRFDPTSTGAAAGSVTVKSNAPDASASLSGTGINTELSRSPGTLSFGDQDIDAGATAPETATITNSGTETVTISGVTLAGSQRGQFQRVTGAAGDCADGTSLDPNETCDVRVAFDPSWEGPKSATVAIASNAPTISVALTGDATKGTFTRSDQPLTDAFLIDGPVNAVAFDSAGRTYIGGAFSSIGERTGRGVKLTSSSDEPDPAYPDVDGTINAVVPDGDGGWYIGGTFSNVGGTPRANLAHIESDGSLDSAWNPGANGVVSALAVDGTTVFVGGDFTELGGEDVNYLGKLTGANGNTDSGWSPEPNGTVAALTFAGGELYVGGSFTAVAGQTHNRVARLSPSTGEPLSSWNPNPNGTVKAIAVAGSDVFLGGSFTQVSSTTRNRIAKVTGTSGQLDPTWNPNAGGEVLELELNSGELYVGGSFTTIGGESRNRVARLSTATGNADSWDPNASSTVNDLEVAGGSVYVAGAFTQIGGQTRNRIARLDTSSGQADSWNPNANATANAVAVSGNDVYVGGAFTSVGGQTARGNIARLLPDGSLDPDWNPGANNTVNALIVSGSDVYAGGAFTSIGGQTRNRLAKLTTADGGAADATWNPNAGGTVNSLALSGPSLYVGGGFTTMGGTARNRIAKVASGGSGALDNAWNPGGVGAPASVLALAVDGSHVYAGGAFIRMAGEFRFFAAKLDAGGSGALDPDWQPDANGTVRALVLSGSHVFAGGDFTEVGGQTRNRLAKLATGGSGTADLGWDANADGAVRALAIAGADLYAGGDFSQVGGVAHGRIVRLPVNDGGAQDSSWDPAANGTVNALAANATKLAAGGSFTSVFGQSRQGAAVFELPRIARDPSSLQFGDHNVNGGPTLAQTATVSNSGTTPLAFSSLTLGGTNAGDFERLTGNSGDCTDSTTLAAGESCTVRVRFDPSATGVRSAYVTIAAPGTPDATIGLAGRGSLAEVAASPAALDFGKQDVDDGPAASQTSTVTNSGSEPVTIDDLTLTGGGSGDYTQLTDEATDCFIGRPLASGASCTVRVEFDPSVTGARSATVTVGFDAVPDATIALGGDGTQTELSSSDTSLAYGKQDIDDGAATREATITNSGTELVTLSGVAVGGTDSGDFTQLTNAGSDCANGTALAAGQTCKVRVAFDPTTVGAKSASVTVSSNAAPVGLTLSGTGTQTSLGRSPTSLSFGPKDIDDGATAIQESTVTNSGTEDVTITGVPVTGDFTRENDAASDCTNGDVLAAGDTCKLRIAFDPASVGAKTGSATVSSNAADVTVALDGTGIQTTWSVAPTSLALGDRDIDDGPTSPDLATVTNTGTETLTIGSISEGGADASDFEPAAVSSGDCYEGIELVGGASCELRYRFDPATVGAKTASLTVSATGVPDLTVSLSGRGTQTQLSRSPDTLSFGGQDIDVGPTSTRESTVTNSGTEPVSITSRTLGGTNAGDFEIRDDATGDCTDSTTLNAGDTCKLRVRFDPSTTGAKSATLTVASNAPSITVALSGTGTQTEISGSPSSLSFGSKDIDDGPTDPQAGTITNTGTEDVTLGSVGLEGADAGHFQHLTGAGGDCAEGTLLHQNETCKVRVQFDPTSVGSKTATAKVSANGVDVTFALSGTGIQTQLSVDPSTLPFGSKDIDDGAKGPETAVVTNSGTETVSLSGLNVTGDFAQVPGERGDCTETTVLDANQTCNLRIEFDPTSVGSKTGTATVLSNAADVTVSLSGTGIQTLLAADPTSLSYSDQDIDDGSETKSSTITNTGTEDVTISDVGVTGDFTQATGQDSDCEDGGVLEANETCNVRVTFNPSDRGARTGKASVTSNAATIEIALDGEGTQTELAADPTSLSFSDQDIDTGSETKSSTITNTGTEPVTLSAVNVTGDFSRVTGEASDCADAEVLAANDSCTLRVRFDPSATGSRTGSATVSSNAADVTVALDGEGIQTLLTVDPASLSYSDQDIDDGSETKSSTITNSGTEDVTLSGVSVSGDFSRVTGEASDCADSDVLSANETCTLRVKFDPSSVGSKTGTATVSSNAADVSVSLAGEGIQTLLTRAPESRSFGDRDIDDGPSSVLESTVTNSGTEAVTLTGVSVSGDFTRATDQASDCTNGTVLAANATCKLRVAFDPASTGPKTGTASVTSNAATVEVALDGEGIQTELTRSPTSLSFGKQDVDDGATTAQESTVTNSGTETVALSSVGVSGDFARATGAASDCAAGTVLDANETCNVRVTFDPTARGARSGTATVTASGVPDQTVDLTGTGTDTGLSLSQPSLAFGDRDIDDGASDAKESVVTNSGTETVTLTGVNATGDFATATGTSCTNGTQLQANETCTLRLAFDPSSVGAKTGAATVKSNASDVTVTLSGRGTQTLLTRSPETLSFGNRDIDDGATAAKNSVIKNTGTEKVTLTGVDVTGDFAAAGSDCADGTELDADETCTLRVTFDPASVGPKTGAVTVTSNAATVTVGLDGSGIQTELSRSPASLAFGSQDVDDGFTAVQEATVTNSGTQQVTLSGVAVSGDFARVTGNASDCVNGKVLAANDTCKLRLRFNPSSVGAKTGSATVQSNAATVSVALSGSGIQTQLDRSPSSLAFGERDVDDGPTEPQTSVVTNNGTEDLKLSSVGVTGDFAQVTGAENDCAAETVLDAGEDCDVRVRFDPAAVGQRTGTATVQSDGGQVSVALSGTGVQTQLTASPTTLAFGKRDIDDGAGGALESTLTNSGSQPVTLAGVAVTAPFAQVTGNDSDCTNGKQLGAGASCKLRLTFDPTDLGASAGSVTVSSNSADVAVGLSGTGTQTAVTRDLESLAFGNHDVDDGSTSAQEATVANTGTEPVQVTGVSISGADGGAFERVRGEASDCVAGGTLDAGQSCKLRVRFDPSSTGGKSATATVATQAGELGFGLSGTGVQTDLGRTPTALAFGTRAVSAGPTAAQQSTLTNTGTEPVTLSGVSIAGPDAAQFALASGGCGAGTVLAAGATCAVGATFDPSLAGAKTATLTVTAAGLPDVTVSLAGTGVPELTLGTARTRGKRLTVPVTPVGGPVSAVRVVVRTRAGKLVARGKRVTTLSRKRTVSVTLRRKLKRGRYVVQASGNDGAGNAVTSKKRTLRVR